MTEYDFRKQPPRPELKALLERVESLGVNCELGLVQRHCWAEPIGLFRFSYTPVAGLIRALDDGFGEIANPSMIKLDTGFEDEWTATHQRYGFVYHTTYSTRQMPAEEMLRTICIRFKMLARKFVADVKCSGKLFVYRPEEAVSAEREARAVLAALQRYGNPTLLFMDLSRGSRQTGLAAPVDCNLMAGFLDRFTRVESAAEASFNVWLNVLLSATALMDRGVRSS